MKNVIALVTLYNSRTHKIENYNVNLRIDTDALAKQLGAKAIKNKSRQSKIMGGVIVCQVIEEKI